MRKIISAIGLIIITLSLNACVNVATTGAQAIYNRHSIQKNLSDQYITMQANQTLKRGTKDFLDANITVATFNGEVLLAGQVPEQWQKSKAQQLIQDIPNIRKVYNVLTVSNPSSPLTRVSDAWLTAKVKSRLIACNDVDATQIKVVTENGVVYLMGVIPPEQATAAVEVASNTQGVLSVVKIFSYIIITKNPKLAA